MKATLELTATEIAIIEYLRAANFNGLNAMVVLNPDENTKLAIIHTYATGFAASAPTIVARLGSIAIE